MDTWSVVVGNIGTVFDGTIGFDARNEYYAYIRQSQEGRGRASGEPVTLFKNGDITAAYSGTVNAD